MNLKGNLTSKGLQGSISKSRMQGILGTNPTAIPITVDNALSLSSTNPVQNRVITAAITNRLWSDEVKTALLQIVEKVAYIDADGQDYYDALYDALYPPVGLDSIGAEFDAGGATIYTTDTLDDLKQYLTVTAYYSSGDSEEVTTYTLSGSMDAGTQTITVSYGGKTTTFVVTVVEWLVSIDAVFTQGSATIYDTDSLDTLEQYLVVTATYADSTTAVVTDYTMSGTLEIGTSTITVSYGGKSDTFDVVVTEKWDFEWDYSKGLPNNNGMTLTNSSGTISLLSDGLSVSTADSSTSNVVYKYESIGVPKSETVAELVFSVTAFSSRSGGGIRCYPGLGGSGGSPVTAVKVGQFLFTQDGIRYLTTGSTWDLLYSATMSTNTEYVLRFVQTPTNCDVYLNGNLVGSLTTYAETVANPQFTAHRGTGALFKSFKLKWVNKEA